MIFRMLPTSLKEQIAIEPDDITKVFKTVDSSRRQWGAGETDCRIPTILYPSVSMSSDSHKNLLIQVYAF